MVRITIVTRIRLLAAIVPAVLLIAAPFIAGGFYLFGGEIDALRDHELLAAQAAHAMEIALYQMEWARTQRDSAEILMDQRRAFGHWMGVARDSAESADQRQAVDAIALQAEPLFDQMRNSAPEDESVNRKARDLHARISDLVGADDQVLTGVAGASRRQAARLIGATVVTSLVIPWLCFVAIYVTSGKLRRELRAIRQSFEHLCDRPAAAARLDDADLGTIDAALARLGFSKPDPMLDE